MWPASFTSSQRYHIPCFGSLGGKINITSWASHLVCSCREQFHTEISFLNIPSILDISGFYDKPLLWLTPRWSLSHQFEKHFEGNYLQQSCPTIAQRQGKEKALARSAYVMTCTSHCHWLNWLYEWLKYNLPFCFFFKEKNEKRINTITVKICKSL